MSADEYTPTTDKVREDYVFDRHDRWDLEREHAFDRWLDAHDAEIRAERVAPNREKLIAAIADYQYCGSCAGAPENTPWCKSCQGEADALIASGVFGVNADTIRAEAIERFHPTNPNRAHALLRYGPGCLLHGSSCEEWAAAIEYRKAASS